MSVDLLVCAGERLARYGFGDGHPFGTDRHEAFYREFAARGLDRRACIVETRRATSDELCAFHSAEYVELVRQRCASGHGYLDGGDTPAWRGLFEAASDVVGATLRVGAAVASGEARRGFVPIAGLHHAARHAAAGFCVFNDIGALIEQLRARFGLRRIGYVDIDAHHGDGVFYAYESDADLILADLHEDGRFLYPGTGSELETGRGSAAGTKLNIPLLPGADDTVFAREWPRVIEHLERFAPQFLILQCGADSIVGDPIAHLSLTPAAHARAAADLAALAGRLGHGRLVALGGGGYNRRNLALAWNDVVAALLDAPRA
jgi:acetoin utilization protein AcuC